MKRVISFSLFGNVFSRSAWHWYYLPSLIRGYNSLFPSWEMWFYHDENIYNNYYGSALLNLRNYDLVKLIYVSEKPILCKAMQWRMKPLWESNVEYFLCRDVDHIPTGRERQAVEAFIDSKMLLHCINDNVAHSTPMMGGMIGFKADKVCQIIKYSSFEEYISSSGFSEEEWSVMGADQKHLCKVLWPILKQHSCLHRPGWRELEPESKHCYFNIPSINVSDVPQEAIELSNSFCNFIGTPSKKRDEYIQFMDKKGPEDKIGIIKKSEEVSKIRINTSYNHTNQFSVNHKKVVLACDTNIDYFFFLPLISLAWQELIGYCPIILIIGSKESWLNEKLNRFVLDESRRFGAEIYFIDCMEGHRNSTFAQISRLYASLLGYSEDTYLLTSDVDLLPLSRRFFNQQDFSKQVHLFYGNVYDKKKFPLGYIGADVSTWKQVMRPVTSDMLKAISWQLDNGLGKGSEHWTAWNYDEFLFGVRIFEWDSKLLRCQIIERQGAPPIDRIDRSNWHFDGHLEGKVDAHLLRPGYTQENWSRIGNVLRCFLPENWYTWVENYHKKFMEILERKS